jgi:formate dehydrogenase iron-sulfur subunit
MGRPTVVNNVISLASVPVIFEKGADHYASFGVGRSRGTVTLQIAGNVNTAVCLKPHSGPHWEKL